MSWNPTVHQMHLLGKPTDRSWYKCRSWAKHWPFCRVSMSKSDTTLAIHRIAFNWFHPCLCHFLLLCSRVWFCLGKPMGFLSMFIGQSPANCLIFLGQILHFAGSTPRFVGWSPMFAGVQFFHRETAIFHRPIPIFHSEISAASKSIDFSRPRTASRHSKRLPANNVCLGAAINACADADLWRHGMLESEPEKCHWNQEFYRIDPPTIWPHIFWSTSTNWNSDGVRKKRTILGVMAFSGPKKGKSAVSCFSDRNKRRNPGLAVPMIMNQRNGWDYEFATHNFPKVFAQCRLSILSQGCLRQHCAREAVALLFDMPRTRWAPNIICYNASITACVMHVSCRQWDILELRMCMPYVSQVGRK